MPTLICPYIYYLLCCSIFFAICWEPCFCFQSLFLMMRLSMLLSYQFVSCLIFNYSHMGWAVYKIDWFVAKMYIYEVLSYFCDGDVCYLFSVMVKVFCLWWILQMFVGLLMAVAVCLYHHNFFVQQFEWEVSVSFAGVCTGFV